MRHKTSKIKIAFAYSSKAGAAQTMSRLATQDLQEDDDEPPPDLLAECDSDETILAIKNVLEERYDVFPIEGDENAFDALRSIRPTLVFNISERIWGPNRESHIPTLCEILNIPYTGSDPLTLGICLVKSRAKEILAYHAIPTPLFFTAESTSEIPDAVHLPAIVKPLYEGSSKGVMDKSVVESRDDLIERVEEVIRRYQQPAIVEHFIKGREFTVGVLGNYPHYEVLPIVEINHHLLPEGAHPIYSYEAKWVWDTAEAPLEIFACPANIPSELQSDIVDLVKNACRILNVKDWCRVDVRLDDSGTANILELNPLPGILPREEENSCLPKAARTAGYSYSALIHRVIHEALTRYGIQHD